MAQFHNLTIKDIQRETQNAVTLSFDVPGSLSSVFNFSAGQYITLKANINGEEVRRDYSLCSSPKSGNLTIAIKAVKEGVFSNYANTKLKVGDVIEVAEPNGRFIFEPNSTNKTIVAFAAGSGITPILSILKTVLEEEPQSKFILVYGNKTIKDTIFLDELLSLKHQYDNRLNIQFVYSQAQEQDALFGRIEKSTVNLVLKNKYKNETIDAYYLCGPEAMITAVTDVLIENGATKEHIHFELFTPTVSKSPSSSQTVSDGNTDVKVIVDEEESSFSMPQNKTILEVALENNIDAPYSCQGGICSSCIARVTEGTVTMRQNNILTDNEVSEGLILTCQSQPTSQKITIDYDDV